MFLGQHKPALWAADKVRSLVTRDVVSIPDRPKLTQTVEGYHAMKSHVQVRFGRWQEIIDEAMVGEPELYVLTTAMQHYAKGVAFATLRDFSAAERERERFHLHLSRIPPERRFLSNPTRASLAVGAALLDGELAYHQGRMRRPTFTFGKRSSSTTISPTPNPGHGCTHRAMRWPPCSSTRVTWKRPNRSTATIWASAARCSAVPSTRTMSGRCTAWWNV
ncbi:hypothetical protein AJ88_07225 [Mesorhizobium amorphae CCBAU 01583]|nr:hypothetical protein AJ88_07225 [Mesorhizobium amorphae CCBAU 01583]